MPSDPAEITRAIKAACDIVAVVGSYLTLRPAGATFKGLCPFHDDTRPSLDVDPRRQRYRCWACGAHGDVFTFIQQMEKVDFLEARALLAARAGIRLDAERPSPVNPRRRLLEVLQWAQARYHECLLDEPLAETARKYLGERSLTGATVRQFGLGYAPLHGDWLLQLARRDVVDLQDLAAVGLLFPKTETHDWLDRFRDRLLFPIRDVRGQVIAFGGRILPTSPLAPRAPKYYNSAESPLFSKSEVLFGLDLARQAAASSGYFIIVEGYTDVLMAHQCGFPQAVATMGTALTPAHIRLIRRFVPKVILLFDADAGGLTGVDRALELFLSHEIELSVAALPAGMDPCDVLVRSEGSETFQKVLNTAIDAFEFKLNQLIERYGTTTVEGRRRITDEILKVMAAVPEETFTSLRIKQELMLTRLAHRLGVRMESLWSRFGELRNQRKVSAGSAAPKETGTPRRQTPAKQDPRIHAEKQLLEIVLAEPALFPEALQRIQPEHLVQPRLRRIYTELASIYADGGVPDLDALRERLIDRPELYADACRLQWIGQQMSERPAWLQRLLCRLDELRVAAEREALRAQLLHADEQQAAAILQRLQQTESAVKVPELPT